MCEPGPGDRQLMEGSTVGRPWGPPNWMTQAASPGATEAYDWGQGRCEATERAGELPGGFEAKGTLTWGRVTRTRRWRRVGPALEKAAFVLPGCWNHRADE